MGTVALSDRPIRQVGRLTSWVRCWVSWLSVVCIGEVWLLLRLSPLGGRGWHPGPGEAIPEQHMASGEGACRFGGLRWKRERESYR